MIKLIWRFALIVALGLAFAWLADRPGSVTILWLGRESKMSVLFGVAVLLASLLALLFLWNLLRQVWRSPRAAREFWRFRKHRKGYEALSKGIIAAGAGDAMSAARHAATAGNALSDEPLVNVLAAQAAQLKGDKENVRRIFAEMAKSPETEVFGLRGLFSEARAAGDLVAALHHAERALSLNPRLPWASAAVLQVQTARKSWEAAALTLEQQGKSGLLEKDVAKLRRAALLAAEALRLEDSNADKAFELSNKAHDLDPTLVPAAAVLARILISRDSSRKATKLLRMTFEKSPHPDLADLMAVSHGAEDAEARFERVRDGVGEPSTNLEAAVALARAAIAAQRFDVARTALASHIQDHPQARVCALMAQIEDATLDKGRTREWLARAIHAPRDPLWVSDGVASTRWVPVSPVTGEIVPCQWRVPYDVLPVRDVFLVGPDVGGVTETTAGLLTESNVNATKPAITSRPLPDDPGVGSDDNAA